jgi:hypothetical protein
MSHISTSCFPISSKELQDKRKERKKGGEADCSAGSNLLFWDSNNDESFGHLRKYSCESNSNLNPKKIR